MADSEYEFTYEDVNGNEVDLTGLIDDLTVTTSQCVAYNTSGGFVGGTGITSGSLIGTSDVYSWDTTLAVKSQCDHVMGDETETEDGQVVGFCTVCGDKIKGRRMVGGYGLARLKDAIVDALGDREAMAGLLDEIDRVELMLKVEEQALKSAHDMLNMAREMVEKIVLPEDKDDDAEAA